MAKARASQPKIDPDEAAVQAPAVITPLHVRDRETSIVAGSPKGWRKWTPLEAAYEQGKLAGGNPRFDAARRFAAGQEYAKLWDTAQSSGRDSTQALNVSRGGGSGLPMTQAQADAVRALVAIESRMGQRDRVIIRMVCGHGHFPSEAVALVSAGYMKATTPRFQEALDALVEAIDAVHRR